MAVDIPRSLLPEDGRFGAGPSKVRDESLRLAAEQNRFLIGTSHRQSPVESLVGRVRDGLREFFDLPSDQAVLLGNGGPSTFWDIAVQCLIERRSRHLSSGEWGERFIAIVEAAPHLEAPVIERAAPGTAQAITADPTVDAFGVTHCETSTGVVMTVDRSALEESQVMIVDATSSAGACHLPADAYDAFFFGPQKVFGCEAGMWFAFCSPRAIERASRIKDGGRWSPRSLDLLLAADKSGQNHTSSTPSVLALALLADQIDWMMGQGGLPWVRQRVEHSSSIVYGWAEQSAYCEPFVIERSQRSPVVAVIDLAEGLLSADLCRELRANGIVDVETRPYLGLNQIRISTFPNVEPSDVEALVACIDYVAARLHTDNHGASFD